MRTELCWLDDVEVRPVEERPLDDAALEVGPVDAVVVEVIVDADRPVERRKFHGRHAPQLGVQLVDLVAVVVGNQEEIVSTKTRCRFDREKTATTTECSVVSETSLRLYVIHRRRPPRPRLLYIDVDAKYITARYAHLGLRKIGLMTTTLHPLNGLFSRTTWVSRCQKGKTSLDLNEARDDGVLGCSGISWTICKQSAPRCRQITTPTPHQSLNCYRPDALPDAQPTVSKH